MPLYEYTCQDCKAKIEILRNIKDADAPLTCEQCSGNHVIRNISLFNASSGGRAITGGSSCSTCSGGSCSTCGTS
jgi:putative FmdB family regulatory protein